MEKNRTKTSREGDPRKKIAIMRWLGHVTRMDEVRILKQALQWEVPGFKRGPGRPRINWRDIVNKDIQRMGLTWEEVEVSAQDRQTWRQRVALCIGDAG